MQLHVLFPFVCCCFPVWVIAVIRKQGFEIHSKVGLSALCLNQEWNEDCMTCSKNEMTARRTIKNCIGAMHSSFADCLAFKSVQTCVKRTVGLLLNSHVKTYNRVQRCGYYRRRGGYYRGGGGNNGQLGALRRGGSIARRRGPCRCTRKRGCYCTSYKRKGK